MSTDRYQDNKDR